MFIKQLFFAKTATGKPKIVDGNDFSVATGALMEDNVIKRLLLCYKKLENFSNEDLEKYEFGALIKKE